MKRKISELLSSINQGLIAFALVLLSGTAFSQTTYTLNYSGASQSLALLPGSYSIQCWGANGGTSAGGKGGYSTGSITITSPTTLHIYVGGVGTAINTTGSGNAVGGWNGGGNGSCNSSYGTSGGGGGGSDVRTTQNTTYANRIIVGGGGGGGSVPGQYGHAGGNGGGTTGGTGVAYSGYWAGQPGTQTAGGPGTTESNSIIGAGSLGVGGNHSSTAASNGWVGCGGGGGYYGGSAGGAVHSGGGGGSGYVGGVSSGTTIMFNQSGFVANPVTTGNGLVLIKELCSITLVANGFTNNPTICAGQSLTLTTNAVNNYSWSTGATTSSIVVTPTANTVYGLAATSSLNCNSSAQITVIVNNGLPNLTVVNTASSTSGICPSRTVALTASGANTYTWTGGTPVTNGVPFAPTSTSGYTVTGENACGTSTAATSVSIHALPTVTAVISQPTICSGNSINITGIGNAASYSLSNGVQNGQNFFPTATAIYTVTGYSAQSCTATSAIGVTVVTTPAAAPIASPPLICIGNTSTLSSSGATNYTWTTPTGTFSTQSITVNPTATTIYTLTKANANCVNTQTVNLTVNMLPSVFAIVTPTLICASRQATLQGGGAATYTWMAAGPPVFTVTGASPIVSPSVSTMYTVTASDGTCVNTTTVFLAANPNPTITISPTSSVLCRGQSVTLTGNGAIGYTWTSVAGFPTTNVITDTPQASTLYNLTGENNFSCTSTAQQVVIVNPTPTLNVFSNKPLVCAGAAAILTVTGAGTGGTYVWDANANNATTSVTTVNPLNTTVYSVTGFIAQTGCSSSKTIQVNVFLPTFAVNNPTSSCLGGMINLTASGAVSYTWLTQPNPQYFSQISVSPPSATVYVVAATSNSSGVNCISTQSIGVSIYANPTITAAPDRTLICKFETTNLNGYGGVSYQWSTSQTGSTVPVSPLVTTVYQVVGTDQNGCTGTTSYTLKVSTCFGLAEADLSNIGLLVYPNPSNGNFTIKSQADISLNIINELGQVVKTILLSSSNNNQCQISDLAAGVYFITGQKDNYPINEKIVIGK